MTYIQKTQKCIFLIQLYIFLKIESKIEIISIEYMSENVSYDLTHGGTYLHYL